MVGSSYDQKPYRRSMMETWGATVHRSPSDRTQSGLSNASHPTGSLGIAISEAVEIAAQSADTNYALGSVLNHVLLHQTVIGQETIAQMALAEDEPDVVIALRRRRLELRRARLPVAAPGDPGGQGDALRRRRARGLPDPDEGRLRLRLRRHGRAHPAHADVHARPRLRPPPVHAGGLRYHGDSPLVSRLVKEGRIEARAYRQSDAFAAAMTFARTEGLIPAPEPTHALRAVVEEAEAAKEAGEERVILFGLCGHGHFDLAAYDAYLRGELEDPEFDEADARRAIDALPDGVPLLA